MSSAKSGHRYAAFKQKKYRALKGFVNVVKCDACGAPRLNQFACKACGTFRGRSVEKAGAAKTADKVVKVKA